MNGYFYVLIDTIAVALIGVALAVLALHRSARLSKHGTRLLDATAARLDAEVNRNHAVEVALRERISSLEGHSRP